MPSSAYYVRVRAAARFALWAKGYGRHQINAMIDGADEATIDQAAVEAGVAPPDAVANAVGAFGDGHVIQAIVDFIKSPAGQQLIAALIQILIAAIGGL